jgi:hypothetical protein
MGLFEDQIKEDSGFTLSYALDWSESDFRQDFARRWGLEAKEPPEHLELDDWLRAKKTCGLAAQIAEVAATLLARKGLGHGGLSVASELERQAAEYQEKVDRLLSLIEQNLGTSAWSQLYRALLPSELSDPRTEANVFKNAFELETARIFPYDLQRIAKRLHALIGFLVQHHNARTSAYLGRVAACYSLGLRTEFVVMARAVLDTALQEAFEDDLIRTTVGAGSEVGLERRITYCESEGVFDRDTGAAARRVKKAGDDAVHFSPGLEPESDAILQDLVRCLTALPRGVF